MATTVNPYLTFNGNCEAAFNHYKSVFGGEFDFIGKFGEMPPNPEAPLPDSEKEKIMHVSLPIGGDTILMGSDSSEAFGQIATVGDNFSVSINTDSKAEADRLFKGLAKGGTVKMPMSETFWGAYFGMFVDAYGIHWMVNHDIKQEA